MAATKGSEVLALARIVWMYTSRSMPMRVSLRAVRGAVWMRLRSLSRAEVGN